MHWSEIHEYPDEEGFWSVTRADDVREVSLDWQTFSSERGGVMGLTHVFPLELQTSQFIAMDPPKHDRLKTLFQRGFTPKRIADHEDDIRAIAERVLDGVAPRGECDLVSDVAQPVVSRVIGQLHGHPGGGRRGLGDADELGARARGRGPQPGRDRPDHAGGHPRDLRALPGDDRRASREPRATT